jgi:hypothetical protein
MVEASVQDSLQRLKRRAEAGYGGSRPAEVAAPRPR